MCSLAQERGIRYVRGRVSGCKELPNGDLIVRAQNTLIQKIFSDRFDLVSLSTGMRPCLDVDTLTDVLQIGRAPDGFFASREWFRYPHDSTREGILSRAARQIKPIRNCIIDGTRPSRGLLACSAGKRRWRHLQARADRMTGRDRPGKR